MKRWMGFAAVLCGLLAFAAGERARGEEIEPEYRKAIEKGLEWVAKNQHRDGHWDATGGAYPTTMTALGGMALLMEGSTLRDGKYATNIRKAVDWYMEGGRCQRNGLIGNPANPTEAGRYMYGHGFGLLFLASVYGEEEDGERRKRLEGILTRAVDFCGKAQSSRGGWYYASRMDGGDMDEGSVTVTQMQGLRAARNAGIVVPKGIIENAEKYLEKCTTGRGGIIYSLSQGGGPERPALTAAGIACMFSAGEYNSPLAKKWLKYCQTNVPSLGQFGRMGHDEYTHYYYAQALYMLGEKGYEKLFPDEKSDNASWPKYRKSTFDFLVKTQNEDGSWTSSANWGHIGPIYATATALTILQLDKATLPIYQR